MHLPVWPPETSLVHKRLSKSLPWLCSSALRLLPLVVPTKDPRQEAAQRLAHVVRVVLGTLGLLKMVPWEPSTA